MNTAVALPNQNPKAVTAARRRAALNTKHMTPAEKVAAILSLLEPGQAKGIAAQLDDEEIGRVISAYENMRSLPKNAVLEIIANYVTEIRSKVPRVRGGSRNATELATIVGYAPPAAIEADANGELGPVSEDSAVGAAGSLDDSTNLDAVWQYIEQMPPQQIIAMLSHEIPTVIAAVLAKLPASAASVVLSALPDEKAIAAVAQMAQGTPVSNTTMNAIITMLRDLAKELEGQDEEVETDMLPTLTAILNRCPMTRQELVLAPLREVAAEHAGAVEATLIRFINLHKMLPRNIVPTLFREADESVLHAAIRFGDENAPETVEFLYSNISQRLAEQIREQINSSKMPSQEEGENAQAELVGILISWTEAGRFEFTLDEDQ